jgi:oxalate---CoA ligase
MTDTASTIAEILKIGADDAPALSSPGGVALSYRALRAHAAKIASGLADHGIGHNDRVAIVLDNGPEMATAFLSIASAATAAPLNPTYRAEEFEFYLTDLRAKLLIVAQGKDSPSVQVADKLGIPIARLVAHPEQGAGSFDLEFPSAASTGPAKKATPPSPDDIARAAHLGHHVASQDRAARAPQHRRISREHSSHARAHGK